MPDAPWMPIDTAPTDGTRVLVWDALPGFEAVHIAQFGIPLERATGGNPAWFTGNDSGHYGSVDDLRPTHWMPLPPPPAA